MISHTTLGTNNIEKADSFYFDILGAIGGTRFYKDESVVFWEFGDASAKLAISVPFDGKLANHGNGSMVALRLTSNAKVDEVFARALGLGATSEGEPGERNNGAFYGAYFRDLDNNKIAIFHKV